MEPAQDIAESKRIEASLKESKEYLAALIANAGDAIIAVDADGRIVSWNNAASAIYGYADEEILGKSIGILKPSGSSEANELMARVAREGTVRNFEARERTKSGALIDVSITLSQIRDASGKVIGILGIAKDITEKKKLARELREHVKTLEKKVAVKTQELSKSEESYRNLVETSGDAIFVLNLDGSFAFINSGAEKLSGYSKGEALKMKFTDVLAPEYLESTLSRFKSHMSDPSTYRYEIQIVAKDGKRIDLEVATTPLREGNKTIAIQGIARDITERKKAEEALRQSEKEWQLTFDSIPDLISIHDNDFRILRVNKAFEEKFGVPMEEIVGKHCYEVFHGRSTPWPNCPFQKTIATGETAVEDVEDLSLGGIFSMATSPIFSEGKVVGSVHVCRDVTPRKRTEEELRSSREFMKNVFESSADAIITTNMDGITTSWSKGAEGIYGHKAEDMIGKNIYDLYPASLREERAKWFNELMAGEKVKDVRTKIYRADGSLADITLSLALLRDDKGMPIGTVGISKDITEHLKAEEALKESEEKYRNLVDNALVGIYKTNLKGDILYVNNALVRMFEFGSPEEFMSGSVLSRYKNPRDRGVLTENLKKNGKVERFETEALTKTGRTKNVLLSATLEGDTLSGMLLDITERKQAEKSLKRSLEELDGLYKISHAYHYLDDVIDIYGKLAEMISKLIGARGCAIILLDKEKNQLRAQAPGYNVPRELINEWVVDLKEGMVDESLIRQGGYYLSNDAFNDPRLDTNFMKKYKLGCVLNVPMATSRGPVGLVSVFNKLDGFTEDDTKLLSIWANQAAIVIENLRLYEEHKRAEEGLKKAHEELQKKFAEQQKFMKFAVGRELKMIDLKNKIKELEQRLAEYGGRA